MATKRTEKDANRKGFVVVGIALAVAAAIWWWLSPGPAPQLQADADVFKTVDALYTAVRMKDKTRLSQCEGRLKSYRAAGKLPDDAALHLAGIVEQARAEEWQPATEALYDFMLDQRREATVD